MEYLDVLDEFGNKTGVKKLREEIHKDGDWHACVHVWLINSSGQILLQKRSSNTRTYPGLWAYSAGGHILAGENPEDAVVRETFEEMGLTVTKDEIKFIFINKNQDILNNNQLDHVFIIKKDINIQDLTIDPTEVEKVEWFDLVNFEKLKRQRDPVFVPKSDQYHEKLFAALHRIA